MSAEGAARAPIYLDNHATTPCDPRVVEAMLPYFTEVFGNAASRTHSFGMAAKAAVERARVQVAALIGASPREIVWTSGATESDNLAVLGGARFFASRGRHLVISSIEHKAVLDAALALEQEGWEVTRVRPEPTGVVAASAVEAALRDDTVLVSVMAVNNEIGTVQPLHELGALCRSRGIALHTDASQAPGRIPLDVVAMQVDLLSLSAHKMYGPKGVGALFVRRGRPRVRVEPLLHGGGHERGMRSGTLPVPLIVGMGRAAELSVGVLGDGTLERIRGLRERLWEGLQARLDGVHLNGSHVHRVPGNLNVSFEGVEGEALLMGIRQVAVSSGSACSSATLEPSYVLRALGVDEDLAHASIRFGIGRFNTVEEIDHVVELVTSKVTQLRELGRLL